MSWFKSEADKNELKRVGKMAERTAKDIRRVEKQDLVKIKRRQDAIEQRLKFLQQELEVQTRNL